MIVINWTPLTVAGPTCHCGSLAHHPNREGGIHHKITTAGIDLVENVF